MTSRLDNRLARDIFTPGPRGAACVALLGVLASAVPGVAQVGDTIPADSVVALAPLRVEVLRISTEGARTPYAVAGLGPAELSAPRGGAFLADALTALPGLQIQNRYNFAVGERIAVRGFGSRSQFGVRGLRIYLDGIPATLPDGQSTVDHVDAGSLGRVELLRGPASALYGNGAGGVLLMQSVRPENGRRVFLGGAGGSFGYLEGSAGVEEARDGVSSRIQLTRIGWDGFRADPVDGGTYGAAERWTVTGHHRRPLGGGTLSVSVSGLELDSENPGSLPADSLGDPDRSAWGFNVRQGTGKEIRQFQAGAAWRSNPSPREFRAALWGLTRDLTNPIPNAVIDVQRYALGGQVAVGGSRGWLRWDAGLDLEAQRDDRSNFENNGGDAGALTLRQDEAVTGLGAFAAVAVRRRSLDLHAALRYDRVHFSVDDGFVTQDGVDESGSRTMDAWSPSVGAQAEVAGIRFFSSFATFLQTPTTTELANRPDGAGGFNPDLEPTVGWTVEAGARGNLSNRLGWELATFRTDLRDELVPFEVPSAPGRTFYRNAGESRYRGVEAALRAALPLGITTRVAYTLVNARFRGGALDGNRVPGRAPSLVEAVVSQEVGPGYWSVDIRWSDGVPVNDDNTTETDAYVVAGVRGGVQGVALGALRLSPWVAVQNILDEDFVSSVAVNAFGGRYFEPGPGRSFRLGVRAALER